MYEARCTPLAEWRDGGATSENLKHGRGGRYRGRGGFARSVGGAGTPPARTTRAGSVRPHGTAKEKAGSPPARAELGPGGRGRCAGAGRDGEGEGGEVCGTAGECNVPGSVRAALEGRGRELWRLGRSVLSRAHR